MNVIPLLKKELEQEAQTTRKMLALVPDDKFDWQPHPKSMTMKQLAVHVGEIPGWVAMAFNTIELDFAAMPYDPSPVNNGQGLLQLLEQSLEKGKNSLENASEDDLLPNWTIRTGEHIHAVMTKYELIRHSFSQTVHHRAQLGVYLRLLDIPIPGSYGPSADDMNFLTYNNDQFYKFNISADMPGISALYFVVRYCLKNFFRLWRPSGHNY